MGHGAWALALLIASAVACGDAKEPKPPTPGDTSEFVGGEVVEVEVAAAPSAEPVREEPTVADAAAGGIEALLAKKVNFDFAGASVPGVVEMIATESGAKIVIPQDREGLTAF